MTLLLRLEWAGEEARLPTVCRVLARVEVDAWLQNPNKGGVSFYELRLPTPRGVGFTPRSLVALAENAGDWRRGWAPVADPTPKDREVLERAATAMRSNWGQGGDFFR